MRVVILKDYASISSWVAHYIYHKVHNTKCVIGLPTGSTPIQVYNNLIDMKTNFQNVTTFNMDEYIGLPPDHHQSYHYFMNYYLFNKTKFYQNNIPNGMACDIVKECKDYEQKIKDSGGIDLFLCGIGTDGHLAFNEPGSSFSSVTRIKTLTSQTISDNSRHFKYENIPTTAITVGLQTIMDAKEIIIMASGINKSTAIKYCVEGPMSTQYPCSIAQNHTNATVVIDYDAANELMYKTIKYYIDLQKKIDLFGNTITNYVNKHIFYHDKILITSPHPDDDVIGMGGTMDILPNKSNVKILYMTNGQGGIRDSDNLGKYTRIKEAISSVKILDYNKEQVVSTDLPFYTKNPRTISDEDSLIVDKVINDFTPNHIFICSDPDPKKTHIHCLNILKNCKINNDTKIWLYKSAWQQWSDCSLVPNVDICISKESFERKLLAIDMHISQINPPVYNDKIINSFKDIVKIKDKSYKYFDKYCENFYLCDFKEFKTLNVD